jgi:hypothetical protein
MPPLALLLYPVRACGQIIPISPEAEEWQGPKILGRPGCNRRDRIDLDDYLHAVR